MREQKYFEPPNMVGNLAQGLMVGSQLREIQDYREKNQVLLAQAQQKMGIDQEKQVQEAYQQSISGAMEALKTGNVELAQTIYNRGAAMVGAPPVTIQPHMEKGVYSAIVDPESGAGYVVDTRTGQMRPAFNGQQNWAAGPMALPQGGGAGPGPMTGGGGAAGPAEYEALVEKASRAYNVPPEIIKRVIQVESAWDPKAESPKGAMGLMQLMPGTARDLGVADPWDPEQNVMGGAKYLAQMRDRYQGDWKKALAAYNAGPGRVDRRGMGNLPRETNNYLSATRDLYDPNRYIQQPGYGKTQVDWNAANQVTGKRGDRLRESIKTQSGQAIEYDRKAFEQEQGLRKEWSNESKDFITTADAFRRIKAVGADVSAISDVGLVFSIMKMYDPGSTVREGEQATASNAAGVPERMFNWYNKVLTGETLTPKQRNEFIETAERVYGESMKKYQRQRKHYEGVAKRSGLNPENILFEYALTPEEMGGQVTATIETPMNRVTQSIQGDRPVVTPDMVQRMSPEQINQLLDAIGQQYGGGQ